MNYDTFDKQPLVESQNKYYPAAIPPDPLQRYGSGHLDQDIFGIAVSRLAIDKQMAFVKKVMFITTSQFALLSWMIFFIVKICPLFKWLKDSTYTWWIPLIPTLIIALVIIWQLYVQYFQLAVSTRSTLLTIYTVLLALVMSNVVSKLIYQEGILVVLLTVFGLSCSLLYTFQKKYYFRGALPFVCSLGAICLSSVWLRYMYEMDPLEIVFPIACASVICIYIILEIYYIIKNVTSDDYLLANIYLFIDFVYPIRFIHHFCELTDNMDVFPDILYPGDTRDY